MRPLLLVLALAAPVCARIEVQGHRGARAERPENTLAGFRYAISLGVDVIELDLGVTRDDHLVVLHDQQVTPDRCARKGTPLLVPVPVRALSLAELRDFDCGSRRHPRFPRQERVPGAGIPTLAEVLALGKGNDVRFNIETKIVPALTEATPTPERFAALVVEALRSAGVIERSTLQSFDQRTLLAAARLEPRLGRALLIAENHLDHVAVARAASAAIVSPHHEWITREDVERMHGAGLRVVPWTANRPEVWARLVQIGVDGIISDDPKALIAWLRQRGLR